ncbi:hypothetical protein [uncultured Selenomonas sp.]|uniref:hypothetical protein n=1 Tax=uncultured Selenomonas sp. TaxID=159275 RepID=UPI0026754A09|nr:hypothetical protein [uncultured Selenomonas sp.]
MAYLSVHGTDDAARVHSSAAQPSKKAADGEVFAAMLGEALSTSDSDAKRNSVENICKWSVDPEHYPEPDDEALIAALYNDDLRDYSTMAKPRIGGRLVVCQKNPDGSLFYYPPRDASFEEKRAFVDAMKGLSREERYQVNNLISDMFGFSPFHPFLRRQSQRKAGDVQSSTLFDLLRDEVIKDLKQMHVDDPNRPWREQEAAVLDKIFERREAAKRSAIH